MAGKAKRQGEAREVWRGTDKGNLVDALSFESAPRLRIFLLRHGGQNSLVHYGYSHAIRIHLALVPRHLNLVGPGARVANLRRLRRTGLFHAGDRRRDR